MGRCEAVSADLREFVVRGPFKVTVKALAKALGLANFRSLYQMIDRNPEEFTGKVGVITIDTPSGKQQVRVINYHGVIRAAMLSLSRPPALFFVRKLLLPAVWLLHNISYKELLQPREIPKESRIYFNAQR